MEFLQVVRRRKQWVVIPVSLSVLIAIVVSLLLPKTYQADAVLMPLGNKANAGMLSQVGSLGFLASMSSTAQTPNQQFITLLNSRTLAEKIVERFDLLSVFFGEKKKNYKVDHAVSLLLEKHMKFEDDRKFGVLRITGEFGDPQLAADIVNGYVSGLQEFLNQNSFTIAKKNRVFIESQLKRNEESMGNNEEGVASSEAPLTLKRDMLGQAYGLLSQQYEMAKIEEARDDLAFQIVDSAKAPLKKHKPERTKIVMGAFGLSVFLSIFACLFAEFVIAQRKV